jgi:hypothetical protein
MATTNWTRIKARHIHATPARPGSGTTRKPLSVRGTTHRDAGTGEPPPGLPSVLRELFGPMPPDRLNDWSQPVRRALVDGDYEAAVTLCSLELKVHPTVALALFLRGAAELELGHYSRAVSDVTRAIAHDLRFAALAERLAAR